MTLSTRWRRLVRPGVVLCSSAAVCVPACSTGRGGERPSSLGAPGAAPEIPFSVSTLENGLRVILHRDTRLPVVAVDVWYRVGSLDESAGRSGFAHLFEHLMFQGSRHVGPDAHFRLLEEAGASDANGSTDFDRTNYFETVPREELPLALWLESDRMGFLLDTLTQDKLDNQRAVVKNEKRQSYDGAPYGLAHLSLFQALFPEGHPYRDTPIGRFQDLDRATLEDVRDFFRRHYGPANATLVVAGDFEEEEALRLIHLAFGSLPGGPAPTPRVVTTPPLPGEVRQVVDEPVAPLAKVTLAYLTPPAFAAGDADLDILAAVLADGKGSRLYRELVEKRRVAQSVDASQESLRATGIFTVDVTVAPGHTPAEAESAVAEVLTAIQRDGPSAAEVRRALQRTELRMFRSLEKVGGMDGRAEILQTYNHYLGDPGYLAKHLEAYRAVTPGSVREVAARHLRPDARVVQHAVPKPAAALAESPPPTVTSGDGPQAPPLPPASPWRASPPPPLPGGRLVLPVPERAVLDNGLTVMVVRQPSLPLAAVTLVSRWGAIHDEPGKEGRATLAAHMLTEGVDGGDAAAQADALADLGTELSTGPGHEATNLSLVTHARSVDEAVRLASRAILSPTMSGEAFARLQDRFVNYLDEQLHDPQGVAMHLAGEVALGRGHPYGNPREGTLDGLRAVTVEDVKQAHRSAWVGRRTALVVAGDVTLTQVVGLARAHLGSLPPGDGPSPPLEGARPRPRGALMAVEVPGAPQAAVLVGRPGLSAGDARTPALVILNAVLGGNFTSRLNLNLREDKGITYGAFSYTQGMRGGGIMAAGAPVEAGAVGLAVRETLGELKGLVTRPVTPEEMKLARQGTARSLPGEFESLGVTAGAMARLYALDLPLDHFATLPARLEAVTLTDQATLARDLFSGEEVQVLLVGDRAVLERGVAEEKLGAIRWLDVEGRPVDGGP